MHRTVYEIGEIAGLPAGRCCGEGRAASAGTAPEHADFIEEWRPVLYRLGCSREQLWQLARTQGAHTDIVSVLASCGGCERGEILQALSDELGLRWLGTIDPHRMLLSEDQLLMLLRGNGSRLPVKYLHRDGNVYYLLSTRAIRPGRLQACLRTRLRLAPRMRIVDDRTLRAALIERARPLLSRIAVNGLSEKHPGMSAHIVANAWQGYMVGILVSLLPVGIVLAPMVVLTLVHALATVFFFACVILRFLAAMTSGPVKHRSAPPVPEGNVPTYSVLIALYKEANVVPDLLTALDWIVWPREKLEIKLVCEADDHETLTAIRACPLPSHIEVVEVPAIGPRTKPKALSYALPLTSGDFVVLYDAEDWPDPMQLAEAWEKFRECGRDVAVLQAPLEISNAPESKVARMFAFEYRALFHGLLPFLARNGFLLPLGGTSNHFRRAVLEEVGGWDPFNVTEDADLGLRLARFGYRADVLSSPTYEKAPRTVGIWIPQRTRWFKGWAQTWLVHMRHPIRLARDLGFRSFLMAQVLFGGMLASALLHPVLLATFLVVTVRLQLGMAGDEPFPALLAVDMVNVSFGYLAFLLLGWRALGVGHKRGFWKVVALTPVYWAMMSWAGWRAIWQLWRQPFRWEKTPHENMMTSLAGPPGGGSAMKQIAGAAALWPMRAAAMTPRR
jgi:cellulose synthase/poly-beta-1,6-N-acetylglucosamine synthase-like glycosyltransferase